MRIFFGKFFNVPCNAVTSSPKFGEITVSIDLRGKFEFGGNCLIAHCLSRGVEGCIIHLIKINYKPSEVISLPLAENEER